MNKFIKAITPRKVKYKEQGLLYKGRLYFLLLHLSRILESIITILTLGYLTIDLSEYLLFNVPWMDD